jgi:o-succinylbenzoate---CoA ligase
MSDITMKNWLLKRAEISPDRVALIYKDEHKTFQQLKILAVHRAKQLTTIGVKKGDHIALLVKNELDTVVLFHALQLIQAVIVPINIRLTAKEISWQLEHVDASLVIYHEEFKLLVDGITINRTSMNSLLQMKENEDVILPEEVSLDTLHTIIFTSGTTGHPKGAMLTYGNHWWSATGSALNLGIHHEDRWLCPVPLFHVSGLSILMRSVIYGMTVILQEKFDPTAFNQAIVQQKVTITSVVSAMLSKILEQLGENQYPNYFRCMLLGGGPAPKPILEACRDKAIPVYQTYGMTETASQIVTLGAEDMLRKLGSAGKALFPSQLNINKNGAEAGAMEEGEIVVKGPNVTCGYYKRQDATNASIHDGWLYTGDIGYLDDEGFLYVLDRRKDLIISGGENIYPAEVESVLLSHPEIQEAGVVGMDDHTWGQVPIAFIVTKTPIAEKEVVAFCRENLAGYKVPKRVYLVEELPRNASNKLLRRELKKLIVE